MTATSPIGESILRVLELREAAEKVAEARRCAALLANGIPECLLEGLRRACDRPGRPDRPALAAPNQVPRRRLGSLAGRAALLHALAHIEFNAINLAFDLVARFAEEVRGAGLPLAEFVTEWIQIGVEEAKHFSCLSGRLQAYSMAYGDLAAHGGLWDAAASTSDLLAARLAIVHLVLEARGLDVTPDLAAGLRRHGDPESAVVVETILADEIGHVATARRWFDRVASVSGAEPAVLFRNLVETRFRGALRPPFNSKARSAAGLSADFYEWDRQETSP